MLCTQLGTPQLRLATLVVGLLTTVFGCTDLLAQSNEFKQFNAPGIFQQLDNQAAGQPQPLVESWWDGHVTNSLRNQQPLAADVHTLLFLALQHSNNIKIAKRDPLIRETAVQEADSSFDWVRYLDTAWNDTSAPIGNSLTAGGTATRLNENVFTGTGGLRRLTRYGGILDVSQRFGWQDSNSLFLVPDDQATSQFTISYTHPLLRGSGFAYNNSLVFLAQLDSKVAQQEFLAVLQDELLEITRNYWALYLERATLSHQMRLFLKTQEIYQALEARQGIDTQRTQLITAASALENRRADLIRARTAVTNAETRLRGLINAPELANTDVAELVPVELPVATAYPVDFQTEIQTALQYRPEVLAAIRQVKGQPVWVLHNTNCCQHSIWSPRPSPTDYVATVTSADHLSISLQRVGPATRLAFNMNSRSETAWPEPESVVANMNWTNWKTSMLAPWKPCKPKSTLPSENSAHRTWKFWPRAEPWLRRKRKQRRLSNAGSG